MAREKEEMIRKEQERMHFERQKAETEALNKKIELDNLEK